MEYYFSQINFLLTPFVESGSFFGTTTAGGEKNNHKNRGAQENLNSP